MRNRVLPSVVLLVSLVCPAVSEAAPFVIDVARRESTTSLQITAWDPLSQQIGETSSRTTVSADSISDALVLPATLVMPGAEIGARASVDLFGVYADTSSVPWGPVSSSAAAATSILEFSPVATGLASINIDFVQSGIGIWSEGLVSLQNLTTNQQVWNYGWTFQFGSGPSLPTFLQSIGYDTGQPATLNLQTAFNASDRYLLTMHTRTSASFDGQTSRIQLNGLQAVPEPATMTLMTIGGVGMAIAGRRRRRR